MVKLKVENGIRLKISLREIFDVYVARDDAYICYSMMAECEDELWEIGLKVEDVDCGAFSFQFGCQWMEKILGVKDSVVSKMWYFDSWNSGSKYSYFSFLDDRLVSGDFIGNMEVDYRVWVLGQVVEDFGDVEFDLLMVGN